MPRMNFPEVPDMDGSGYEPIPEGTYLCRLEKILDDRTTKAGDEMWGLEWVMLQEKYAGRKLFDNLVFSKKAASRVKFLCSRLGLDTTKEVDLTPAMLTGRQAWVTTFHEEYQGKMQNRVPWDGYEAVEESKAEATQAEPAAEADPVTSGDWESSQDVPF